MPTVPPAVADWCDDGAFARLVLAEHGHVHDLLDDVTSLLRPDLAEAVRATLDAWGV